MGAFCLFVQAYILEWSLILVVLTFINLVADKHLQECVTDKKFALRTYPAPVRPWCSEKSNCFLRQSDVLYTPASTGSS